MTNADCICHTSRRKGGDNVFVSGCLSGADFLCTAGDCLHHHPMGTEKNRVRGSA